MRRRHLVSQCCTRLSHGATGTAQFVDKITVLNTPEPLTASSAVRPSRPAARVGPGRVRQLMVNTVADAEPFSYPSTGRGMQAVRAVPVLVSLRAIVVFTLVARRLGGDLVVHCRQDHLFTTLWILWSKVEGDRFGRRFAADHHDVHIP